MQEEDGLDMTLHSTSRPITPSPNDPSEENRINQTPKAKTRYQLVNPFNCPEMLDKEFSEIGELQDEYLSDEEEYMVKQIKIRLEDILEELTTAKATQIQPKLDAANWAACFTKLTGGPIEDSMDKHIIANLAETNAYLTKRVIELELKDMDFIPPDA